MVTLTIRSKGQVTLRWEILRHLGVTPGDRIELITLPGGRIELRAVRPSGSIDGFIGELAASTPDASRWRRCRKRLPPAGACRGGR
jgi:antitoxin PrlF